MSILIKDVTITVIDVRCDHCSGDLGYEDSDGMWTTDTGVAEELTEDAGWSRIGDGRHLCEQCTDRFINVMEWLGGES